MPEPPERIAPIGSPEDREGRVRVGVDTGGTFTDFVVADEATGEVTIRKLPSTPENPATAIVGGLSALLGPSGTPGGRLVSHFCHGTTVGTNALLEGKGARTGLLVTAGFRGIYEIMEQARPYGAALFDVAYAKPRPLASGRATGEVTERVDASGGVVAALDEDALRETLQSLRRAGVESLAVCLLFSFLNPEHERRVADIAREVLPGCPISLSSEILPQIREYYRLSTTVINAYLQPRLATYLRDLDARLSELAVGRRYVMQSGGGMTSFAGATRRPATTLLSGPAAGVIAGSRLARDCGVASAITFDMGGTSCDVALIEGGRPAVTTLASLDGRHIALPMMDIATVSAGGGTLAYVGAAGTLEVGPHSAGAVPGPACYGRGGERPTVTDANLVLGLLSQESGSGLRLDAGRAARAIDDHVAAPLGLTRERAAGGILDIVDTTMEEAVKGISVSRGHDIRDFALVAFGGAGPVHAASLLDRLRMRAVIVPPHPGVFSAMGLLMTDVQRDYVRSQPSPLDDLSPEAVAGTFAALAGPAVEELCGEGFAAGEIALDYALDLRYRGQGYELTVDVGPAGVRDLAVVRKTFDELHNDRFGHMAPAEAVEVVSYRVTARGPIPHLTFAERTRRGTGAEDARTGRRRVFLDGGWAEAAVYARDRLDVGARVSGPAVVEQSDSTVVVRSGQTAETDRRGNLVVTRGAVAA